MSLIGDVIKYRISQIEEAITKGDINYLIRQKNYHPRDISDAIILLTGKPYYKLSKEELENAPFGRAHLISATEFVRGGRESGISVAPTVHTTKGWEPPKTHARRELQRNVNQASSIPDDEVIHAPSVHTTKGWEPPKQLPKPWEPPKPSSWFSRNKGKVALGVGIPVALAAGYYAYKKYKGRKKQEEEGRGVPGEHQM